MNKYNSQSNCFTALVNGYVRIYLPASSSTASIYVYNKKSNKDFMLLNLPGNSNSAFYSIYMKKNLSVYVHISSGVNVSFLTIQQ